jgi:hypothetical protein
MRRGVNEPSSAVHGTPLRATRTLQDDRSCEVTMRQETAATLRGGLFAGLIGYFTIVVFFVALNLIAGRSPFYTAALFGSALFFGLRDAAQLEITPAAVLTFNMVHALVMLAVGLVASWLVSKGEKYPLSQYVVLVALIFVGFHLLAAVMLFAMPLLGALGWVQIVVASAAAAIAMGVYLLRVHPLLLAELRDLPMGDVPPDA